MINIIKNYQKIDASTLNLITAEFFVQLINASFMQILLIYMAKSGYHDSLSANFISYRFLGVLLFSVPLGIFIRGRKIKPLFLASSIMTPFLSILVILAIDNHQYVSLYVLQFLWGISFSCIQVPALPYILRNTKPEVRMEAMSLSLSTWSLGGIIGGLLIFVLARTQPLLFDEKTSLILISCLGFLSVFFAMRIKNDSIGEKQTKDETRFTKEDGWLLFKAVFPTILLAVGAGLTIPFVGLFFYHVHGFDSDSFAFLSAITTIIVFASFISIPWVKDKFGTQTSILWSQGLAIFFLVNLAFTQVYQAYTIAVIVAVLCYMARQPLMNMVSPLVTDVAMVFVGKKNHELMSALQAAIWSGSWFISSKIFLYLRKAELDYVWVFLITAIIYTISVLAFYFVILRSDRIKKYKQV